MLRKIKRIVMLAASLVVFLVDSLRGLLQRALGTRLPPSCVVLYYHSIPRAQQARFARQMDCLLRRVEPVKVDHTSTLKDGVRYAAVTFDDGYEDVVHVALPVLAERKIPATIFVVTECLGQLPGWRHFSADFNGHEKLMSIEQLSNLPSGLISVGSHTRSHPLLTALDEQAAKAELVESRSQLEKLLNRSITLFSFPYGAFDANLVKWCREAGYTRVFTILPVLALTEADEFVTGRVSVGPTDWHVEFILKLLGAYRWQPAAFAAKKKMLSAARAFRSIITRGAAC